MFLSHYPQIQCHSESESRFKKTEWLNVKVCRKDTRQAKLWAYPGLASQLQ